MSKLDEPSLGTVVSEGATWRGSRTQPGDSHRSERRASPTARNTQHSSTLPAHGRRYPRASTAISEDRRHEVDREYPRNCTCSFGFPRVRADD
jgi:hypothetical protein